MRAATSELGDLLANLNPGLNHQPTRIFGDKEPGEPALPITLSDCGGSQRQPALACPDDR
jgi:hypothetical protein